MTEKEHLRIIIERKGSCMKPTHIFCDQCLVQSDCMKNGFASSLKSKYKLAVEKYLELYGQEDLVEILI